MDIIERGISADDLHPSCEPNGKAELPAWGRQGGRPVKLDRKDVARVRKLLARGQTQAECAAVLGVSVRTIGRFVAQEGKTRECALAEWPAVVRFA